MKPIEISSPEMCGTHMLPITRQGKQVICPIEGVIGITSAAYETNWKPPEHEIRRSRGHSRGRHQGEIAR